MKAFLFWVFLVALILIHAIDMELTTHYIGDEWQEETFPFMRICIYQFGIYNSVWISRICTYAFFIVCYNYKQYDRTIFIMFLITVIYYLGMVGWLFTLDLVKWPI